MMVPWSSVRLFQRAQVLWVLVFVLSAYAGSDAFNVMGLSPRYVPPGPLKYVTHGLALLPDAVGTLLVLALVPTLVLLCVRDLLRAPRWWSALLIWFIYVNLMDRAWLAGSGGQQLMANLLFWNIPLAAFGQREGVVTVSAFWIIRLQLLLAYAATAAHKVTGALWLDGSALGIAASDPAFGPRWIAESPAFATIMTWAVLVFQLTFPLAVWWRRTRYVWMLFGVVFHVGTALWMDIPEMGFAFIVAYTSWIAPDDVERCGPLRWLARAPSGPRA